MAQRDRNQLFAWLYSQTDSTQDNSLIASQSSICDDVKNTSEELPAS
jgi:hypothetical protein